MRLIILSGDNKEYNTAWTKKVKESLKNKFSRIDYIEYKYWDDRSFEKMDLDFEMKQLVEIAQKDDEEYFICAKGIGIILMLKAIYDKRIKPCKCVFVGLPVIWARLNNYDIDKWINSYGNTPTLIIQHERDPSMYFEDLQKYIRIKRLANVKIIKIPGKDMYYEDYDNFLGFIDNFISTGISCN